MLSTNLSLDLHSELLLLEYNECTGPNGNVSESKSNYYYLHCAINNIKTHCKSKCHLDRTETAVEVVKSRGKHKLLVHTSQCLKHKQNHLYTQRKI